MSELITGTFKYNPPTKIQRTIKSFYSQPTAYIDNPRLEPKYTFESKPAEFDLLTDLLKGKSLFDLVILEAIKNGEILAAQSAAQYEMQLLELQKLQDAEDEAILMLMFEMM